MNKVSCLEWHAVTMAVASPLTPTATPTHTVPVPQDVVVVVVVGFMGFMYASASVSTAAAAAATVEAAASVQGNCQQSKSASKIEIGNKISRSRIPIRIRNTTWLRLKQNKDQIVPHSVSCPHDSPSSHPLFLANSNHILCLFPRFIYWILIQWGKVKNNVFSNLQLDEGTFSRLVCNNLTGWLNIWVFYI